MAGTTTTPREVATGLLGQAVARRKDPKEVWGISWGQPKLNHYTGGIQREEMSVMMARPGVGKTSWLEDRVVDITDWLDTPDGIEYQEQYQADTIRLVLVEMSAMNFQQRLTAKLARVPLRGIREGTLNEDQWRRYVAATERVANLPIEYLDEITHLDQTVRFLTRPGTLWWGLDYIQIHPTTARGQAGDTAAINIISTTLRDIAKRIAPGLALSQMTREVDKREDKRPQLADLRGSGQLEADAAVVLGLYREDIYKRVADEQRNEPRAAELLLLKQRNGDSNLTIDMWWYPNQMTFQEAEKNIRD